MPALNKRVKDIVDHYTGGNVKRFSEITGLASSQKLNRIFLIDKRRGEYPEVSSDIILAIANTFSEVDKNWLLTGDGDMLSEPISTTQVKLIPIIKSESDSMLIPVVEIEAAAGSGAFNGDHIEEIETLRMPPSMIRKNTQYYCLRIRGRSMEPTLQHDSYVVARMLDPSEWKDVKDGYIYVISDRDGQTWVKRVKNRLKDRGFIVCTSDNPDRITYSSFNVMENELNTIWYVEWYLSARMPNIQEAYYYKQSELDDRLEDLEHQFETMRRSLNIPKIH